MLVSMKSEGIRNVCSNEMNAASSSRSSCRSEVVKRSVKIANLNRQSLTLKHEMDVLNKLRSGLTIGEVARREEIKRVTEALLHCWRASYSWMAFPEKPT